MKVAIVMGSKSDLNVVKKAKEILEQFGVEAKMHIFSAHRTPFESAKFFEEAKSNNYSVIICAAGKAAHLAGVAAAHTTLPVIGLPIKSSTLDGLDSLLSTVQMPPGVPVATVAIDGAENAALLAIQILALKNEKLDQKLEEYKVEMAKKVLKDDASINDN